MPGGLRDEAAALLLRIGHDLGHEMQRHVEPLLKDCGLTSVLQVAILGRLCRQGEQRLVDLAPALRCPLSTLSETTERLVAAGLLVRQPHPEDRRSSVLGATPAGRRVLAEVRGAAVRHLASLLGGLADRDVADLLEALGRLASILGVGQAGEEWLLPAAAPQAGGPGACPR